VPAQDPVLAPAQVTEDVLPHQLNREDFYVAGASWAKFHIRYPSVSFEDFWAYKMRVYDLRNADAKHFLPNFSVICKNTRRSLLIARFVTK
jgi:hypothetical protein